MTGRSRGLWPLHDLRIVVLPISSLKPNPRNARTHTRRQIRKIDHSIGVVGFNCPIIIDENNVILAGHAIFEAAKLRGMTTVPTMRLSHMTEAEKRAFVIAHDRLAEEAGWDRSLLAVEFKALFEIALSSISRSLASNSVRMAAARTLNYFHSNRQSIGIDVR
jgi:ParB-like chromosome segregation protein Spo0J